MNSNTQRTYGRRFYLFQARNALAFMIIGWLGIILLAISIILGWRCMQEFRNNTTVTNFFQNSNLNINDFSPVDYFSFCLGKNIVGSGNQVLKFSDVYSICGATFPYLFIIGLALSVFWLLSAWIPAGIIASKTKQFKEIYNVDISKLALISAFLGMLTNMSLYIKIKNAIEDHEQNCQKVMEENTNIVDEFKNEKVEEIQQTTIKPILIEPIQNEDNIETTIEFTDNDKNDEIIVSKNKKTKSNKSDIKKEAKISKPIITEIQKTSEEDNIEKTFEFETDSKPKKEAVKKQEITVEDKNIDQPVNEAEITETIVFEDVEPTEKIKTVTTITNENNQRVIKKVTDQSNIESDPNSEFELEIDFDNPFKPEVSTATNDKLHPSRRRETITKEYITENGDKQVIISRQSSLDIEGDMEVISFDDDKTNY